ncbi:MAG: formyl transferase-like protein [Candidatus Eremiobacteraeota bacterium]|nr:formyl transferase-like protein [Candidatus Eremiobacteraeota bacterium]
MNLGVLGSSGGSAFGAMQDIIERTRPGAVAWFVATDRACGLEELARERGFPALRVAGDNAARSAEAANFFAAHAVSAVLLYYDRLVTAELYARIPTVNFHPAVLPAFPGLRALERTYAAGASEFGATTHVVDASVDGGPVIAQVRAPLPAVAFEELAHISFVQKTYLALLVVDGLLRGTLAIRPGGAPPRWLGAPELAADLAEAYADFAGREQVALA